jgi:hypothetical protein
MQSYHRSRYRKPTSTELDLNSIGPENDGNFDPSLGETTATSSTDSTTVYFRDIEQHLLRHISEADAIVGCIAWLTNRRILEALAKLSNVAIVVQKEDFLRPDLNSGDRWREQLRKMYTRLRCSFTRYDFPGLVSNLSVASDPTMDSVRCVGNYNRDKSPAFPRMHHKFIVFCRLDKRSERGTVYDETGNETEQEFIVSYLEPYAVWTGSFNFTENAVKSLENSLYITDPTIVQAYYDEWSRIEAISEPLDWTTDWVEPEWRIGT